MGKDEAYVQGYHKAVDDLKILLVKITIKIGMNNYTYIKDQIEKELLP